eukprot:COSAG01_NODE_3016_length_6719_cov_13.143202_2_plen_56_part_00
MRTKLRCLCGAFRSPRAHFFCIKELRLSMDIIRREHKQKTLRALLKESEARRAEL